MQDYSPSRICNQPSLPFQTSLLAVELTVFLARGCGCDGVTEPWVTPFVNGSRVISCVKRRGQTTLKRLSNRVLCLQSRRARPACWYSIKLPDSAIKMRDERTLLFSSVCFKTLRKAAYLNWFMTLMNKAGQGIPLQKACMHGIRIGSLFASRYISRLYVVCRNVLRK